MCHTGIITCDIISATRPLLVYTKVIISATRCPFTFRDTSHIIQVLQIFYSTNYTSTLIAADILYKHM